MAKRKGTYILFLSFRTPRKIHVGSLGMLDIGEAEYCYVGSAMNGLDGRIGRHMSVEKKMRWHIDRLTVSADSKEAYVPPGSVPECGLSAMALDSGCVPVFKGFGCSDCRCGTHLFLVDGRSKEEFLNISGAVPFLSERD